MITEIINLSNLLTSLTIAHTLTLLTPSSSQHTHPDSDGKKRKKGKGKREKGRPREEKGGGRRELSTPSHHARRERVAPHHRRPGARRSCPVASPPAVSSSLQLRRHQRPEPREMRPRGGRSAREETRKTDCRRSASPPSNCYSRRALSLSPLSFNRRHLCWGSWSLMNEEGEFKSASEGRKKESRWRSRSPSSRLLLPSTELVIRGASPKSLLMNRLRPCCDLARPHTPFILVSKSAQFFPCSDSIYETE
ncbi:Zinc finger GRF-type protein [Arachis hypogaea]|nr:Zinc finger GRF-type protein [Arachis hypogaea]